MNEDNENKEATPPKKRKGAPQNLVRFSSRELSEMGKKGGKAAQEAYRRRKESLRLMKDIYMDLLSSKVNITVSGKKQEIDFSSFLGEAVKKVITHGGSPAVSMMRELREGTDGSTMNVTGTLQTIVEMTPEERERRIKELEERRNAKLEPKQKPSTKEKPSDKTE